MRKAGRMGGLGCAMVLACTMMGAGPGAAETLQGKVLEVKDAQAYTYLRLAVPGGETWAAVQRTSVAKGATVTLDDVLVMTDFESRAMGRRFERIALGRLVSGASASPHPAPRAEAPAAADVKVPKATGPGARTVAEIVTRRAELKDRPVTVRGKVVRYTAGVMGKNWIHLRDGSGSAADGTDDVLVTSLAETKVGDVVTVKGTVRTDRDFGSGYAYRVVIEDGTLQR